MTLAQVEGRPLFDWAWVAGHAGEIGTLIVEHVTLTAIAVAAGLLISFPLAVYAHRHRRSYPPIAFVAGLLYTIPSLALFAFLTPVTGLTITTAEIGLVGYTLLILIRNIVAGLQGVPDDVKQAALGMGYSRRQLLWRVEFPLALPVVLAGVRLATVTTIGLVTVTAFIGLGGLGALILDGIDTFFATASIVGSVLSLVLALVADGALVAAERMATPWSRARRSRFGV
jgi:osmoprotectant transport system permease protein